jgi:hypothetical protein
MNLYIDTAISLILIFLVFSVIVYVIQELFAVNAQYRGRMLWRSLAQALDGATFKRNKIPDNDEIDQHAGVPLTKLLFGHPQIQALKKNETTLPSYIPASSFTQALVEMIVANTTAPVGNLLTDFNTGLGVLIKAVGYKATGFTLPVAAGGGAAPAIPPIVPVLASIAKVSATFPELEENIGKWYDEYMNRVTGWYQSHSLFTVRAIAIGVAILCNINCIRLVRDIAKDSVLRSNLAGIAERVTDHPDIINNIYERSFKDQADGIRGQFKAAIDTAKTDTARARIQRVEEDSLTQAATKYTHLQAGGIRTLTDTLTAAHLRIGWTMAMLSRGKDKLCDLDYKKRWESALGDILLTLLGWLITAGCLSMGAPFWFNLLIKLVNVRRAGIKPKESKK